MIKVIETRERLTANEEKHIEERIVKDENGFYCRQARFLPLEDYEVNDGWRTYYVSSFPLKF